MPCIRVLHKTPHGCRCRVGVFPQLARQAAVAMVVMVVVVKLVAGMWLRRRFRDELHSFFSEKQTSQTVRGGAVSKVGNTLREGVCSSLAQ